MAKKKTKLITSVLSSGQTLQLCNYILQIRNHIQFSITQHIKHRMISPYCFITLDLQWRCFMCKHWSSCTTHILSRRHFAKVRLSEKQKKKKKICYKVHTHQRCVLSLLHGWNEWSSPPPAEPHLSGLSLFFFSPQLNHLGHQEVAQRRGSTSGPSQTLLYFACRSATAHCSHQDRILIVPNEII